MVTHEFGGDWTSEKLACLGEYLHAYTQILRKNPKAQYLTITYVDAFAGTGYRSKPRIENQDALPSMDFDDADGQSYLKGSARIALEVEPSFHTYLFIDKNPLHIQELERMKLDFPFKSFKIRIEQAEANIFLKGLVCARTDWKTNRAVVFLDPYGMQVDWSLIESIAKTKAIDLWWLFPLGMAVNRLLTRDKMPPEEWATALTKTFGTDDWKREFYSQTTVQTLFGIEDQLCKRAEFDIIGKFIIDRLKTVFTAVADEPLQLCNSRNNPIYLLCFAAGNPTGASTAVKIAKYILERRSSRS